MSQATKVLHLPVQCDAINGNITVTTWKVRCSFPVYLIAMAATAGAPPACWQHNLGGRPLLHLDSWMPRPIK